MSQPCASNHSIEQGFPWLGSEAAGPAAGAAACAKAPLKAPILITITRAASHPNLRVVAAILHNFKSFQASATVVTVLIQRADQITVSAMALKHTEMIASQQCDAMHMRKSSHPHRRLGRDWAGDEWASSVRSDQVGSDACEWRWVSNELARWWGLVGKWRHRKLSSYI